PRRADHRFDWRGHRDSRRIARGVAATSRRGPLPSEGIRPQLHARLTPLSARCGRGGRAVANLAPFELPATILADELIVVIRQNSGLESVVLTSDDKRTLAHRRCRVALDVDGLVREQMEVPAGLGRCVGFQQALQQRPCGCRPFRRATGSANELALPGPDLLESPEITRVQPATVGIYSCGVSFFI